MISSYVGSRLGVAVGMEQEGGKSLANWYSIDFHVHTPVSSDYQGDRGSDEAFYRFMEAAHASDIDIVVVTDHNTLDGFRQLCQLQTRLDDILRMLGADKQAIPEIYRTRLALFGRVVLLPGAELDVYPNLHYIVVFNPDAPNDADALLRAAGCPQAGGAAQAISSASLLRVDELYAEAARVGAVVIAAHADSDKGIYNAGRDWGVSRVEAICDERLCALEYASEVSRGQIASLLQGDPKWHREVPLAFVRGSDFHGATDQAIGARRTWLRIDNYQHTASSSFHGLKRALRNPAEFVSPHGRPEIEAIRQQLETNPFVKSFEDSGDRVSLLQFACAFGNTGRGTIVVGRNPHGNWVGVRGIDEQRLREDAIRLVTEGIKPCPPFGVEVYENDESSLFASISVQRCPSVCMLAATGEAYTLAESRPVRATTSDVVQLAEDALLSRFSGLSATKRIAEHARKLAGIHDSIDLIPLVRRFLVKSKLFPELFDYPDESFELPASAREAVDLSYNGHATGNIIVVTSVRPREATFYLRFSAPLGQILLDDCFCDAPRSSGTKLVFCDQGTVFLDSTPNVVVASGGCRPYICKPRSLAPSAEYLLGYFKSALYLWFLERCMQLTFAKQPLAFLYNMPILMPPGAEAEKRVSKIVSSVLALEHDYLEATDGVRARDLTSQEAVRAIDALRGPHNAAASQLVRDLDEAFFDFLGATTGERAMIRDVVRAGGMAVFDELAETLREVDG
jgi:hypothetical protein